MGVENNISQHGGIVLQIKLQKDLATDAVVGCKGLADFLRGVFEEHFMGVLERAVFGEGEPDAFIKVVAESLDRLLWCVAAMSEGAANVQRVTQCKALDNIPRNRRALGEF